MCSLCVSQSCPLIAEKLYIIALVQTFVCVQCDSNIHTYTHIYISIRPRELEVESGKGNGSCWPNQLVQLTGTLIV